MKFKMLLIFNIICLLFVAESSPITSSDYDLDEHDITETLNSVISDIFRSFQWNSVYVHVRNNTENNFTTTVRTFNVKFENGMHFGNVTTRFQSSPKLKVGLLFYDNTTLQATCEMVSVTMKAYHQNSKFYIGTEVIPLNFTLHLPTFVSKQASDEKLIRIDYHDLDKYNVKLFTNGYEHTPSEETQIKQGFKTHLKSVLLDKVNSEWKTSLIFLGYTFLRGLGQKSTIIANHPDFFQNEHKHYYLINNIPSTDFNLSKVIIKGLWNFRGIELDFSNPAHFPQIEMNDVVATMTYNSSSTVEKSLEFRTKYLYTSVDQEVGRINVRAEGFSVKDMKTNTSLADDQAKVIVNRLEAAIAASIKKRIPYFFELGIFEK